MKKIYLLAAAAALFAACSSEKDSLETQQQPTQLEESAVGFDVYTQRAITRGGEAGTLTTNTDGTVKLTEKGFGVFGYYTDNNEYDQRATPNFFYNQQVTYKNGAWSYEPVKYWPNEYGSNAVSDDADLVSYFAYAPWIDIEPTTGRLRDTSGDKEQWGIISMTRNNTQGDPMIKYIASFNSTKSVDLCWGVQDYGLSSGEYQWPIVQPSSTSTPAYQVFKNGMPWLDVKRPAMGTSTEYQRVKFNFKHALAQMRVRIDADIDIKNHDTGDDFVDGKTRIWVREVTFKGFVMKGTLNLNNTSAFKPYWLDYNGQNDIVAEDMKIYDGRKDGKEGVAGAIATNEKTLGLNPKLIQGAAYEADPTGGYNDPVIETVYTAKKLKVNDGTTEFTGVTGETVNLFDDDNGTNGFFHVIPIDGEKFEVEIVYDVETVSENLAQNLSDGQTKGTSIENRIRKETFSFNGQDCLLPGHSYILNLHLGMNSVKFDAEVTDWIEEPIQDIDLPTNAPKYTAEAKTGSPAAFTGVEVKIPYKGEYIFALTGLNGGETVSAKEGKNTVNSESAAAEVVSTGNAYIADWTATSAPARPDGIAIETLNAKTNPNTTDQTQVVTWEGTQSELGQTFTFIQAAHPLFLTGRAMHDENIITLTRCDNELRNSSADWTKAWGWFCSNTGVALATAQNGNPENGSASTNGIAVYRNGTKLTLKQVGYASLAGNEFDFTDTGVPTGLTSPAVAKEAIITISSTLQQGEIIKVILKTGDAPTETITIKVE